MNKSLIVLTFLFSILSLTGQEREPVYYYGAYAGYNYNIHIADFDELPEIQSCCPRYRNGEGSGFSIGALFEKPFNRAISISVRLGYSSLSGILSENENGIGNIVLIPAGDPDNPFVSSIDVNHKIDSKLHLFGIEPAVDFKFFRDFYMTAGLKIGYLSSARVDHFEKLIYPENVTFLDGRTVRNDIYDREVAQKNDFHLFGVFGAGYQFPIGEKTYIEPELRYYIPFTNISSVNWKPASLQIGAAIKFPIYDERVKPRLQETIFERDTSVITVIGLKEPVLKLLNESVKRYTDTTDEAYIDVTLISERYELQLPKMVNINASLYATGISKDGTRQDNPTIIIEELETEEGFPLLPHIYFKEGDFELKNTAMSLLDENELQEFKEGNLQWSTLGIYSELLNIIASRMKTNRKSSITIIGCNKNLGIEANNLELSRKRAESVKSYLVEKWGIEDSRIKIQSRNLPEKPGNINILDGIEENQRAEIHSDDFKLLKPVELNEIVRTANPPVIEIVSAINAEGGLKEWKLNVKQSDNVLRNYYGNKAPEPVLWRIEDNPQPVTEIPINISLNAEDEYANTAFAEKELNIEQLTIRKKRFELKDDKRIERYSLILFDYDKAEITPRHRTILQEIKSKIKSNSVVKVSGYADRTGERDYNKDLARKRAQEVQKVLQINEKNLVLNPIGSDLLLFDNDLPQGRGYSRTVIIEIETPIK